MAALETLTRGRSGPLIRRGGYDADRHDGSGARLRRRLIDAGPLAASFGIHLGSRVDLLRGTDCLELLEIPDLAPASAPERISAQLRLELGAGPADLFSLFEPRPFESGLLFQWHRAELPDGLPVTVQLVHPELDLELEESRLRRAIERMVAADELIHEARGAVDEFAIALDLERAAEELQSFAEETAHSRWISVPELHRQLSSPRVRVQSTLDAAGDGVSQKVSAGRARRLGRVWLAMVLGGNLFPVEARGRNVRYLEGGTVAFVGGDLQRLPSETADELREYLAAVAAPDPDRAAHALLKLLPDGDSDRQILHRLRHTDSFRDRGWDVGGDRFARQVLAQWRAADELGRRPRQDVWPFYRGLFVLNQEIRRLAGDTSSLRDGFREARLLLLLGEWRQEGGETRRIGAIEGQARLLARLPQKLDRILNLAAEHDDSESEGWSGDTDSGPRRQGAGMATAACLLGLVSVALLTRHLGLGGFFAVWADRVGALLVLLFGGLALRVATRSEDDEPR